MDFNLPKLIMLVSRFTVRICLLQAVFFQVIWASPSASQNISEVKVSVRLSQATITDVFKDIESKTEYVFAYPRQVESLTERFTFNYKDITVKRLLEVIGEKLPLNFVQVNNTISISLVPLPASIFITGRVMDEVTKEPIPGVTILAKGTAIGTITDTEGNFKLTIPENRTILIFSFVGYDKQEIDVAQRSSIEVFLHFSSRALNEVVVVGYGTQLRSDMVANVASVKPDQFKTQPIINANQALQGMAAGVFVTNSSGQPGGGSTVSIRGVNSINGSNNPLYVVDGVPITTGDFGTELTGTFGQGSGGFINVLSLINTNDIASIDVLKDASAKAIYGSRGTNGVILITTKKGDSKIPKVNFKAFFGPTEAIKTPITLTTNQWLELRREAYTNVGYEIPESLANENDSINTNWQDEIYRKGFVSEYQLSLSQGGESLQYYISGNYRKENGIIEANDLSQGTLRINLNGRAGKKVSWGTSTSIGFSTGTPTSFGGFYTSPIYNAYVAAPNMTVFNENGEYNKQPNNGYQANPVAQTKGSDRITSIKKLVSNFNVGYDITSFLNFKTNLSYDYNTYREDFFDPAAAITDFSNRYPDGRRSNYFKEVGTYNIEPQLTFSKSFSSLHKANMIIGGTLLKQQTYQERIVGTGFAGSSTTYNNSASTIWTPAREPAPPSLSMLSTLFLHV